MSDNMKLILERWKEFGEECISEVGMYHSPKTGRWTDNKAGAVKSLTKAGAKRSGVDPKHVGRGVVTAKGKVSAKMGQNFSKKTSCGRMTIDGEDIVPKYKCSDYKERYAQEGLNLDEYPELIDGVRFDSGQVLEAIFDAGREIDEQAGSNCGKLRAKWLQDTLKSLNSYALAMKGDLLPKKEEQEPAKKTHYQGSPIADDKERKTDKRKAAGRRRKLRTDAGVYVEPFNRGEKALLNPNSLMDEGPSSVPLKDHR